MRRFGKAAVLALALFTLSAAPALAHRLKVFATVVGAEVQGKAYFVGGGPAREVAATLRDGRETIVATGRTDAEGRFVLTSPVRADLTVVVDAADGHVGRFPIAAARLPVTLPAGDTGAPALADTTTAADATAPAPGLVSEDVIGAAVARQIEPLAEQIDALDSALRLRDVLGGIGYIVGLFGLAAFLKARRRDREGPSP
jgi:nickel transport protein